MTGRARGRARGRTRNAAPQDTRRPGGGGEGQPKPPAGQQPDVVVGRGGRGRGATATAPAQQQGQKSAPSQPQPQQLERPKQPRPQQQVQPVAQSMAALSLDTKAKKDTTPPASAPVSSGGGRGRGGAEPATKPEHITDKRGSSGREIQVVSNYFTIRNRPNCALYQYNVSYSPPIESKKLRVALLYSYTGIGKTKAFDGMILYLPIKLPDQVTQFTAVTKREETIEITITLTNELSASSPVCIQLFNVIFRRYGQDPKVSVKLSTLLYYQCIARILFNLEMIQIGRHYYYNKRPIPVPAHR